MNNNEELKPVVLPSSRELMPQELADLQDYIDEIKRLRARVAELEATNKKLQDRVSDMALDDLTRLGQEIDAQLSPEDQQAIQRGLRRSVTVVAKGAPPFEVPQD